MFRELDVRHAEASVPEYRTQILAEMSRTWPDLTYVNTLIRDALVASALVAVEDACQAVYGAGYECLQQRAAAWQQEPAAACEPPAGDTPPSSSAPHKVGQLLAALKTASHFLKFHNRFDDASRAHACHVFAQTNFGTVLAAAVRD